MNFNHTIINIDILTLKVSTQSFSRHLSDCCVCVKHKTLYKCLCSSSGDSVSLIRNIGEFGEHGFRD